MISKASEIYQSRNPKIDRWGISPKSSDRPGQSCGKNDSVDNRTGNFSANQHSSKQKSGKKGKTDRVFERRHADQGGRIVNNKMGILKSDKANE